MMRFLSTAKTDCAYAEYRYHGIGSQIQVTEHYYCKKKGLPITEPPFGLFPSVPFRKGKLIGYTTKESCLLLIFKKKETEPIYEWIHPCEDCLDYKRRNSLIEIHP